MTVIAQNLLKSGWHSASTRKFVITLGCLIMAVILFGVVSAMNYSI